jgi:transcriptional regulator with XRE-family HTH domain
MARTLYRTYMPSEPGKLQTDLDIKKIVGRQVRKFRVESGMSQQVLSDTCGIFRTYMSRIESGGANPTITILAALASGLDVDIRDLLAD